LLRQTTRRTSSSRCGRTKRWPGKTLFVWGEQGFGDAPAIRQICAVDSRAVNDSAEGGPAECCTVAQGRLLSLFRPKSFEPECRASSFPTMSGHLPEYDVTARSLSLPPRCDFGHKARHAFRRRRPIWPGPGSGFRRGARAARSERSPEGRLVWSGKPDTSAIRSAR